MSLKTCTKTAANTYTLEVFIEPEVFAKAIAKVSAAEIKKLTVPGFRKGKAPRSIIDKLFGEDFFYEKAINDIAPDIFDAAIEESKLDVIDILSREILEMSSTDGAVLQIVCVVYPNEDVNLNGDYKGLEIVGTEISVDDEALDSELEKIRTERARMIEIEDRPVREGDEVKLSYLGSVDGVPFDGGADENSTLTIGSGQFIPGFEEQLIGHSINESFDINVKFPDDYQSDDLAGKDAVFAIVIKGITETELPELDDDFAKDCSEFDTLDEYKADIRANLLKQEEETEKSYREEQLMDKLVELVEVELPDVLIRKEVNMRLGEMEYNLAKHGLDFKKYMQFTGETIESIAARMQPGAEKALRIRLGLEAIARIEGISYTEDDVNEYSSKIAESLNTTVDKLGDYVTQDIIIKDIILDKATAFLLEHAQVTIEDTIDEEEIAENNEVTADE